MAEESIRDQPRESYTRTYIHVTLEIFGEKITSSLGPISHDEGWAVFQAFLADMKRLKP